MLGTELMTVKELWQIAMPSETTLAGGEAGLTRRVAWVTPLRASYPALGELGQDYMVLARMAVARQLGPRMTVSYLLQQLARGQAAALVIDEPPSPDECALADDLALPLLTIEGGDLVTLERTLLRALVDREGQYARRESEIRQHLHAVYARGGISAVLGELAQEVSGQVTLRDEHGAQVAETAPIEGVTRETRHPIAAGGHSLGELTVLLAARRDSPLDALYIQEAAAVAGIELLQQRVRQETQDQLGADLVEALLDRQQPPDAMIARFRRLGYTIAPTRQHRVLAVQMPDDRDAANVCAALMRDLQWAADREGGECVWASHEDMTIGFCSFGRQMPERRIREWVRQAFEGVGDPGCPMGVSRVVSGVDGLREAVLQAREACRLGQLVSTCTSPYYYEDLGLYRLLGGLRDREELARFYRETVEPLARYDQEHSTELVHTLDVFFSENANASSTARSLFVHRNTLNYRLQRIVEITGMDLNDAEARLSLQLGIKIHHLIRCL